MTGRVIVRDVPRESDELTLAIVRRRANGETANAIARALGVNSGLVVLRTNAVRDADLATRDPRCSPDEIRRAYW